MIDDIDETVIFAVIMIIIAGIPILYFHYCNHDSIKVERYWKHKHEHCYYILEFCVFFLTLCIAIYSRVVMNHFIERFKDIAFQKFKILRKIKNFKF